MSLRKIATVSALLTALCAATIAQAAELPAYDVIQACENREKEERDKFACMSLQWMMLDEIKNRSLKQELIKGCAETNEYLYTGLVKCLNEKLIEIGEIPIYRIPTYCILSVEEGEMARIEMISCFGAERLALHSLLKHQPFEPEKIKKCEPEFQENYAELGQCLLLK